MKALIAAGGSGTRLRPLTFSSNKHVLPIANKPLLLYAIESVAETGIKEVGVVVNETRPAIEALLGDGSTWGLSITYIPQTKPLGLAHVVLISQEFLNGDAFVYHLGDNIFTEGIRRPFNHFMETKPNALLTMVEHEENFRLGVPYFDANGKLEKVVEKPQNPPNKFGIPGLYFFDHHVFEAFEGSDAIKPSARGEYEITDLYTYLLHHGYQVDTEQVDGLWMDPGKFIDMLKANEYLLHHKKGFKLQGSIDAASRIEGNVEIGDGSTVTNSTILGPVAIGDNVVIKDAHIGPCASIQSDVTVDHASLENTIVMSGTSITNVSKPITGSMIGRNTRVAEQTNNAIHMFIGDHCSVDLN